MTRSLRRSSGVAAAVIALSLGVTACGDDAESDDAVDNPSPSVSGPTGAGAATFGEGCAALPATGKGSFDGMVTDPVATAAGNNPLLSTLVGAVGQVPGLADSLNVAPSLTVFAPTNDAFAKIPEADLQAVLADQAALTAMLSHHVIGKELDPEAVIGEHVTLKGDKVTVAGDTATGLSVDGGVANVICGNIPTANARVYVIDSVLMPTPG